MSREPSYYEIALTQRQVVIAFVILLTCMVAAFFSGVWVGSGGRGPLRVAATPETATAGPSQGGSPEGTSDDPSHLRFFSEARDGGAGAGEPTARDTGERDTDAGGAGAEREAAPVDSPPVSQVGDRASLPAAGDHAVRGGGSDHVYADPDDPRRRSDVHTPVRPAPQPPEPVDPRATEPPGTGGPVIQVFSSHDQAQAQEVLDRLLRADLDAYLSPAEIDGVIHYRVRLGPFHDAAQAEAVAAQLRQDYKLETWIIR